MAKKIILTGASGMVGGILLNLCLESEKVEKVISLVRRPSTSRHPKLEEIVVKDFLQYDSNTIDLEGVDIAFFCIGVYTGAVPEDLFRKITVDYPVALAKALYEHSPDATYCLLSGAGADRTEKSRTMFARDKGVAENQLATIGFKAFHTFRPGYIYPVTPRKEPNFAYTVFRKLYPLMKPLMGKNSSITSVELAQGMFNVGMSGHAQEVLENKDILGCL